MQLMVQVSGRGGGLSVRVGELLHVRRRRVDRLHVIGEVGNEALPDFFQVICHGSPSSWQQRADGVHGGVVDGGPVLAAA